MSFGFKSPFSLSAPGGYSAGFGPLDLPDTAALAQQSASAAEAAGRKAMGAGGGKSPGLPQGTQVPLPANGALPPTPQVGVFPQLPQAQPWDPNGVNLPSAGSFSLPSARSFQSYLAHLFGG